MAQGKAGTKQNKTTGEVVEQGQRASDAADKFIKRTNHKASQISRRLREAIDEATTHRETLKKAHDVLTKK